MDTYIFGAHSRGRTTAAYLKELNEELSIVAFLYDNDEENETEIGSVPVLDVSKSGIDLDTSCPVYIATRGVYHDNITKHLQELGFTDIRPVTVKLDTELRTEYMKKIYAKRGWMFRKIEECGCSGKKNDVNGDPIIGHIFEVRSIYDKPLERDSYTKKSYEVSVQVGAALTDEHLQECTYYDNEGDNISKTNRQMCETTAIYWMWKNITEDYLGLVHYRRHFLLPNDWLDRMVDNNIDMILPVPMYLEPSIAENFKFRHVSDDWDVLMDIIRTGSESDGKAADECFGDTIFFPCNMFVMKRKVLDDYCKWAFDILFKVTECVGTHDDIYQNRYPAFMAERLLNLYTYIHRDELNIVYADKNFLM